MNDPDFNIDSAAPVSGAFREAGVTGFSAAAEWVRALPYRRNKDKSDPLVLFTEGCGTCSTKHAALRRLALENGHPELRLMTGLFRMNARNTPKVASVLAQHKLDYLPEAHNYLRIRDVVLDYTRRHSSPGDFLPDLILEKEVEAEQVCEEKIAFHRAFLAEWLQNNPRIPYGIDELWRIREACIAALSVK